MIIKSSFSIYTSILYRNGQICLESLDNIRPLLFFIHTRSLDFCNLSNDHTWNESFLEYEIIYFRMQSLSSYYIGILLLIRILFQLIEIDHPNPRFPLNSISRIIITYTNFLISLSIKSNHIFFGFPIHLFLSTYTSFTKLTASISFFLKTWPRHLNYSI